MSQLKVYVAGPITGQTGENVVNAIAEKVAILTDYGYLTYHPMAGKLSFRTEAEFKSGGYDHPIANNHSIFERDRWMVSQVDVVLVDLSNSGDRISIGTMMELAWASMLGKHTVTILPPGNVHNHAFVIEASDIIFTDIETAYGYLAELNLSRLTWGMS
jgi:nucleoside 2-deoxyribosyltransferase